MTTRTVTGTLLEGDGTAWASGSVVFTLQSSIALDGTSTYPMYTVTATTDGSGNFSATLAVPASGAYLWACTLPDSRSFTFALEAGSSVNINTLIADANFDAATDAGAMAALLTAYLPLAGGTMTAPLLFSGTTHAGIAVISLTTVQRDAIASPATGAIIWNTTESELQYYSGAAWATVGASHDAVTLAGSLDYLTITGQAITRGAIDLTTDVTGDLPVADGGTGASTAADARTNLGLVIGTNVQAQDTELSAIAALAVTDGNIIVGDGATWVAESGATARTSLGLGTGNSPQFTAVNVGSADTTLARVSAGVLSVEGVTILTVAGGTLTGGIVAADQLITRPVLKDVGEAVNAIGSIGGGTQDIDITLGNVVTGTVDTSTTTFTFSNPSASGTACSFTLRLTNGGSQTVNWPASVKWAGGTAPTLTASGIDVLTFMTIDGGTTWDGFAAGLAMAVPA